MIIKNPHVIDTKVLPLPSEMIKEKNDGISKGMWLANAGIVAGVLVFGLEVDAFASNGIEDKAKELYFDKFMLIAKWFIIIKGGWSIIGKITAEDFASIQKTFMTYLLIFVALLGLPWALDQVEEFFRSDV